MAAQSSTSPSRGQAWFCTTDSPSDVVVEVDDMTFHLHKFPLTSKSKKLHDLITLNCKRREESEACLDNSQDNDVDDQVLVQEQCHVSLPSFPGGSETFETAAKFCYGVKIELTAGNVAPLRCAAEVLQMTEDYAQDNLISKTERFLTNSVFKNIKESIMALKSCERLCPLAENLGIVQRCIDAISSKADLYDPSLFGWPMNEPAGDSRSKTTSAAASPAKLRDQWVEDLARLSSEFFNRVIPAMRGKEVNPEIIDSCLMHYAKRCFPGISRSIRRTPMASPMSIASEAEQRKLLETVVSNIPPENGSRSPAATRFLLGLLRTANILNASDDCKSVLERKISAHLEYATLDDLLIPSYSYLSETLYDVDCVQRMLNRFLESYEDREIREEGRESLGNVKSPAIMIVGKLIDGYLSEIAPDANLKPEKFYELAMSLPEEARLYHDGIYRAIDVYFKAHPWITEEEREKIIRVMNCQKLTLEACTHAAQNERLPLRTVIQVLFFEQLQLRHAIAGTLVAPLNSGQSSSEGEERENAGIAATRRASEVSSGKWREATRENQVLRLDMDSMRARVKELERECSTMKKVIEKIGKVGTRNAKGWRSKFGCKFKTQVCNSHESTVVDDRKGRRRGGKILSFAQIRLP